MTRKLALVLSVCIWALPLRADFTFIHASDTHAGSPENAKIDALLFEEMAQLKDKPKFVVVTGDIVDYGTDAEYARFGEAAKKLGDIPLYLAPGNHDVRWNPLGKEGYTRGANAKLYQSWDYQNVHFVTLDSTVLLEHWGHISQEQLDWLKEDLKKVGAEKPVVIGFHHWICKLDSAAMMDNEQALLDVVAPYNVVLWLQGHGHTDVEWNVNGTPATMVRGLYQGSYDIVHVTADEMRITKRHVPANQVKELLASSTQPSIEMPKGRWQQLMTIPLKRRRPPTWDAKVEVVGRSLSIQTNRGDLPADAKLEVRIDTERPIELAETIPLDEAPGIHAVTVRATLNDGRVYQKASTITLPGKVTPAWVSDIGGAVQSRLLRDGDRVYVTSMGNDLVALNSSDGKEAFRVKTGGPVFSSPEVVDGVVYFGSADHFVYAADAKTGQVRWKRETKGAVLAGPAVAKGVVCIGSCDTNIYGLSVEDGRVLWRVKGENMFQSKAATDDQHFFVGGWDNHFRCIDATTGDVTWDLALGKRGSKLFSAFAPAITHPCVGDGKVFVSTNDGILHAISIESGKEIWKVDRQRMGYSSPCFQKGKVYFALDDKGMTYCADANTGDILWQRDVGSVIYDGGFCFGGENVFIGSVNGVFDAIDSASGKMVWKYRLGPGHLLATGAADDARVYIGSMNGKVFALPTKAGQ